MMRTLIFAVALLAAPATAQTAEQFATDAVGQWSTEAQSESDDYDYVASEMTRILSDRTDGVWLFQQNWIIGPNSMTVPAYSVRLSKPPYFQVVIQVRDMGDGALHSTTYRLASVEAKEAARDIGPNSNDEFDPEWIGEVACMGHMQQVGDGFWQGGASCPNGYKGGVKVESHSVRAPGQYVNWDRGFNAAGEHIWGPAEGGYIFKRKEEVQ